MERTLVWDGCLNVRDLGGHPTEDGAITSYAAIVRADSVRALTDAGWAALVEYGIVRIVDLRFHSELEAEPPRDLPVQLTHVPLAPEPGSPEWRAIDALAAGAREAGDAVESTRIMYLELVDRFRSRFADAVSAVGDAPPGGVVVHCHAGKDRTGLVSALLLRLAGVSIAQVADDYAVSGPNLQPAWDRWIADAEDELERERRRRLAATPAEAMVEVLEELERREGGVYSYLREAGASEASLGRARARLRT
jgi:protein-tyrosine phosphatase